MRSMAVFLRILLAVFAVCAIWEESGGKETVPFSLLRVALLDFEDRAGFQGKWNLAGDVPALLGRYLEGDAIFVISRERVEAVLRDARLQNYQGAARAVQAGRLLEADMVVTGKVEQLGMRRLMVGDPNLVGYKSYKSVIHLGEVELIRVATEEVVGTFEVLRDSTENPLGLDLFGRPRQQDLEFRKLFKVDFGSEPFFELPFGKFADAAFRELSAEIIRTLVERPPIDLSGEQAVVLAVEEGEVYLGIGNQDKVEYGDILPLYRESGRVAVVEVHQIIGPHLCKARIVEGAGKIETGLRIGQRLSRKDYGYSD